MTVLRPFT